MVAPYSAMGKQVLHGVLHFADAVSNTAADDIACAMNVLHDMRQNDASDQDDERQPGLFASGTLMSDFEDDVTGTRHSVRQESDEYACSCGKRWDVSDGADHP